MTKICWKRRFENSREIFKWEICKRNWAAQTSSKTTINVEFTFGFPLWGKTNSQMVRKPRVIFCLLWYGYHTWDFRRAGNRGAKYPPWGNLSALKGRISQYFPGKPSQAILPNISQYFNTFRLKAVYGLIRSYVFMSIGGLHRWQDTWFRDPRQKPKFAFTWVGFPTC